jgi:hypothetical protein
MKFTKNRKSEESDVARKNRAYSHKLADGVRIHAPQKPKKRPTG